MRKGGGKNKGSAFERKICAALSLWISNGKHKDIFWRSSMSGGRATVIRQRGGVNRQAGDICSVAPEGHVLTDYYYFECKHVRNISLEAFILAGKGPIASWWRKARKEAKAHGREPVLIMKGNRSPIIVLTPILSELAVRPVAAVRDGQLSLFNLLIKQPFVSKDLVLRRVTPAKGTLKRGMKITYPDGHEGEIV